MTFGAEIWGPMLIQAAASGASAYLGNKGSGKESKMQKTKRHLIDDLLNSLKTGQGEFAGLFSNDESAFQKSFVEPAQKMFKNQIAPQIQQSYIASGQQRNTGLDDQLLRAGVDLDSMLNQHFLTFQNQGKDRMSNMINSILGSGDGAAPGMSGSDAVAQGGSAFLGSDAFGDFTKGIFQNKQAPQSGYNPAASTGYTPPRKGFEPNWRDVQFAQR